MPAPATDAPTLSQASCASRLYESARRGGVRPRRRYKGEPHSKKPLPAVLSTSNPPEKRLARWRLFFDDDVDIWR